MNTKFKFLILIIGMGLLAIAGFAGNIWLVSLEGVSTVNTAVVLPVAIIGIILSLGFALILAWLLMRRIISPLSNLRRDLEAMAQNDLTLEKIAISSGGEVGELVVSANKLLENLKKTIGNLKDTSFIVEATSKEFVVSGRNLEQNAQQVGEAAQQIAAGAQEQTSRINETGESMDKLQQLIKLVTGKSEEVTNSADNVMNHISRGTEYVSRSVEQMDSIKSRTDRTSQTVEALNNKSAEVEKIIGMINGIAEQTNLLALNAAIEAARAGEQGKGFAVVAEEVRKLAEESSEATEQIAGLIKEIQHDVAESKEFMTESTAEVTKGSEIIGETGKVFEEINSVVEGLFQRITEVAQSTSEMKVHSDEVNSAVQDIVSVSEEFAASAEEVAASTDQQAEETGKINSSSKYLSELAGELVENVSSFKLNNSENAGLIQWSSALSVGNDEIDQQHKELFKGINSFLEACRQEEGKSKINEILEFLSDYVDKHFGTEEKYMLQYNFTGYEKHKEQHEIFNKNFIELVERINREGVHSDIVITANRVVVDWLINHIKKVDTKLAKFLNEKK